MRRGVHAVHGITLGARLLTQNLAATVVGDDRAADFFEELECYTVRTVMRTFPVPEKFPGPRVEFGGVVVFFFVLGVFKGSMESPKPQLPMS